MDNAIDQLVKRHNGDSVMVTGWMLVVGTAEGAVKGAPLGFTMAHSEGLPAYSQIGLLESALQSIHNTNLILAMEDHAKGPNPPF